MNGGPREAVAPKRLKKRKTYSNEDRCKPDISCFKLLSITEETRQVSPIALRPNVGVLTSELVQTAIFTSLKHCRCTQTVCYQVSLQLWVEHPQRR